MNRAIAWVLGAPTLLALAPSPSGAQSFGTVLRSGDSVPGVGAVVAIGRLAINDLGDYRVYVATDNPDPDADAATVGPAGPVLIENQPLSMPAGAVLDEFGFNRPELNAAGSSCQVFHLGGTGGSFDDSGVYLGTTLVVQENDVSTAPELTPGTPYRGFGRVELNDAGDALVLAYVDDPALPGGEESALVVLDLDAAGNLLGESVLLKEGDAPPGLMGDTVNRIHDFDDSVAFNDTGLAACSVSCAGTAGGGPWALLRGDEVVARSFTPSPIPGRDWLLLPFLAPTLNRHGTLLWHGSLTGDTSDHLVLVLTGTSGTSHVLARKGDALATPTGTHPIARFPAPACLSDDGDVLYTVELDDGAGTRALIHNGRVLVQEGVTAVGPDVVTGLTGSVALSPNGDHAIFEATLAGSIEAAVVADLTGGGLETTFCDGSDGSLAACPCANPGSPSAGCDLAQGTGGVHLSLLTVRTSPTNRATLVAGGFPPAGVPAAVVLRAPALDVGSPVVFGDGVRCVGVPLVRLGATLAAAGTSRHSIGHGAMAGSGTFHYQAWFRNAPTSFCDPLAAFNLSSGHTITW